MIYFNRRLSTRVRLLLALLSALLLSAGWIGAGGLPLLIAFVPLLFISAEYSGSLRDTMAMLGWAALSFVVWNVATVWWVWNAAPIGTIAATVVSSWWSLVAFMLFHVVSKRAPSAIAYMLFIVGWIACEYIYIEAPAMSFPWLVLGNGFANDVWAVQWYEYTGVLGGSLWVLIVNVLAFKSLLTMRKRTWIATTLALALPIVLSVALYMANDPSSARNAERERVKVAVVQPNVPCYEKFTSDVGTQQDNLVALLGEVSDSVDFVLMPETSLGVTIDELRRGDYDVVRRMVEQLRARRMGAMVVCGTSSLRLYGNVAGSATARYSNGLYYDLYNSSLGVDSLANVLPMHHKAKLVIGVETLPAWFRSDGLFGVDLGGITGQLGIGESALPFVHNGVAVAPAICYEAMYGDFMGEFVRGGAQILGVVSNDGWWGNTPGHRYLFAYCRLRAIEHRRAIARSANTGVSGFIDMRGEDVSRLEWEERGVLTADLPLNDEPTLYTRYGDYIGRLSLYLAILSLLYAVAYWAKRRFYLVP